MLAKVRFWLANFWWGMVAIMISIVMNCYGIALRLSDMIIPDNQLFEKGREYGDDLCSRLTDKLLGWDERRGV